MSGRISNKPRKKSKRFFQATSKNLPLVDFNMYLGFLTEVNCSQETEVNADEGLKNRYARFNYNDNAVGWVQVRRFGLNCVVRGKICPEYQSDYRYFVVRIDINEEDNVFEGFSCSGCNSRQNGCKHVALFLTWLYRKADELGRLETIYYCVKPELSKGRKSTKSTITDCNIIDNLADHLEGNRDKDLPIFNGSLHKCIRDYNGERSINQFLQYISNVLVPDYCKEIEEKTRSQSNSQLWFDMKYGRITGSTIYKASQSTTSRYLISAIFGEKSAETSAMKRGKRLESSVLKIVEEKLGKSIKKAGIALSNDYPVFGASADGVGDDFVVEIKCPTRHETVLRFYDNNMIQPQYKAQIQLQMLLNNKKIAYFVIADPQFEANKQVQIYVDTFDPAYIVQVIDQALTFWKNRIFPKLFTDQ